MNVRRQENTTLCKNCPYLIAATPGRRWCDFGVCPSPCLSLVGRGRSSRSTGRFALLFFWLFGFIKLKGVLKFFHEAETNRHAQNRMQTKKKKNSRNLNMARREGTDLTLLSLENVIELLFILPGRQVKVLAKTKEQKTKQTNHSERSVRPSNLHSHVSDQDNPIRSIIQI